MSLALGAQTSPHPASVATAWPCLASVYSPPSTQLGPGAWTQQGSITTSPCTNQLTETFLCNIIVTTMNTWYCILTCHDTMTNKIGIVECWRWVELLLKSRNQFLCLELDLNFTEITTPGSVLGHCRVSLPYSSVMKISLDKSSPELVIDRSNQWWGHFVPTLSPQLGIFFSLIMIN